MATIELGRLEKVDLRSVFPNEASAFTPWLAKEENLCLLGETIGLDLPLDAQEKSVGPGVDPSDCQFTVRAILRGDSSPLQNQLEQTRPVAHGLVLAVASD